MSPPLPGPYAATHSGPFHADDVLAWGLLRAFAPFTLPLVRTRDEAVIADAVVVFDVGAVYDPGALRFDHHQHSYTGPWSSAGMVLDWLRSAGHIADPLAALLRENIVDYVDDVDNGRRETDPAVPCFARIVDALNRGRRSAADYDAAFDEAAAVALQIVRGVAADHAEREAARAVVEAAMDAAAASGANYVLLPEYVRWKPAYYAHGGELHPTVWLLHPGMDGSWRALAIPPHEASFAQKRSFPAAWAGLTDEALAAVTGVPGSRFCHKNLFIAVFDDFEALVAAMGGAGLLEGPAPARPA